MDSASTRTSRSSSTTTSRSRTCRSRTCRSDTRRCTSRDEVPLRGNVRTNGKLAHDEKWFRSTSGTSCTTRASALHRELPDGFDLRDLTALYYGATTWADDQLGDLLRLLEENSLLDDTIIVFTSDHGDNLGSHGLFNKDVLYEESITYSDDLPLAGRACAASGRHAGGVARDVMPTLLSLAGVDAPTGIQGTDLAPVVKGDARRPARTPRLSKPPAHDRRHPHEFPPIRRHDGGRLRRQALPRRSDDALFFDLVSDPLQEQNLVGEQRKLAAELRTVWWNGTRERRGWDRESGPGSCSLGLYARHIAERPQGARLRDFD